MTTLYQNIEKLKRHDRVSSIVLHPRILTKIVYNVQMSVLSYALYVSVSAVLYAVIYFTCMKIDEWRAAKQKTTGKQTS
jgi:hypothetical protein